MASGRWGILVRQLRELTVPSAGEATDHQLLQRFAALRDEDAFTRLVERHAAMVLGVCRRVLAESADAEDAFQATFCVLARKAAAISWQPSVGPWLSTVAYRIAGRVRTSAVRRRAQEREAATRRPLSQPAETDHELRSIIDDELQQLPYKYRAPLILCYLEGHTNEAAARQLGWPKGTVQGRLARAREALRERLARRGLALSGAALASGLTESARSAAVPASLAETATRTAVAWSLSEGIVADCLSTQVVSLAEGALQTMTMTRMRTMATLFALLAILGGGTGWWITSAGQAGPDDPSKTASARAGWPGSFAGGAPRIPAELATARVAVAREEFTARMKEFIAGRGTQEFLFRAADRLLTAEQALCETTADQVLALEAHLERMQLAERVDKARYEAGRIGIQDYAAAQYMRLDAEIALAQAVLRATPTTQVPLPANKLETLWHDLADADVVKAYRAVAMLTSTPDRGVPFLQTKLRPTTAEQQAPIDQLIASFGDNDPALRQRAAAELKKTGELAEPALRRALATKPDLDRSRRLEDILQALPRSASPELRRLSRALGLLQSVDSREARQLLESLAGGAPGAWLTEAAKTALGKGTSAAARFLRLRLDELKPDE